MTNRREVLRIGGAAALATGVGFGGGSMAFAAAVDQGPDIDPMTLVDPELRPAALQMRAAPKGAPLSVETLPGLRLKVSSTLPPLEGVPILQKLIPGIAAGQPDVKVFISNAKPGAARPAIVFMHGGGLIFGDAKSSVREIQGLSVALDCCVISVDYRVAPETIYPGSIEDNYAALVWIYKNAEELGIDPKRIAVLGESAGGCHAALLAIAARDRGEVPVCFQVLVYPMLDDRTGATKAVPKHMGAIGWSREDNIFGWRSFLGRAPGGRDIPIAAVPARNPNLRGLPPAFIGVGTLDLFFEEDMDYARRLANAGVPVEMHVVPGAYHGFDHNPVASVSLRFNLAKLEALRRAFAGTA